MKLLGKLLLFVLVSLSAFGFKLEGITFNKSLTNGYKEYKLYNDSLKKVRYKIQILPAGDVDVTSNLEVFPKIITIEPQGKQIFKLFGTGKQKLENREYLFELKFDQIVIPTLVKGEDGRLSGSSGLALTPNITMKGHGGTIDYSTALELKDISFKKNKKGELIFVGTLENNSHGTIELGIKFSNRSGDVLDTKGIGELIANSNKYLEITLNNFTDEKQIRFISFYNDEYDTVKEIIRDK